ncbi:hypothetical protein ALP66_200046 [Pseudomonas amygdali pv. photiniae]|uniref:Uncharacterized protein n=1 Tax=Pseudomonas amygdali pv. photiniae TaxID=251724 RepID=A0A658K914_PSEA0|nr:hypothetical protein ALP66_200046 [Pseudomonas amygdali pv. photiniae]
MIVVQNPIRQKVTINIRLRPNLSPRCPKRIPPNGRAMKPIAKVEKDSKVAFCASAGLKKTLEKTVAAINAYR